MSLPDPSPPPAVRAHVGWRLLALLYDTLPVLALWFALAALFVVMFTATGHGPRENIAPFSPWQIALWLCCGLATGVYAVASWRRGGQTLGMRPWRLVVQSADGRPASTGALWLRYLVGMLSLLAGGLGFWWAWIDRNRLTWHDRASGTRLVRRPR